VREPVGTSSAITGCVGDHTGFVRGTRTLHEAVALALVATGSGKVVVVCVELAP
jgi:hypothetical protein